MEYNITKSYGLKKTFLQFITIEMATTVDASNIYIF